MRCTALRRVGILGAFTLLLLVSARLRAQVPALPSAPSSSGTVLGSVVDADGALVSGAQVRLVSDTTRTAQETATDDNGEFHLTGIAVGGFTVTVTSPGWEPVTAQERISAGGTITLPPIALTQAITREEVTALTQHELAEIDLKQQTTQRLLGILPNYNISYNWHAAPLDTRQKFKLSTKEVFSPWTFGVNAGIVGTERATGNYDEFGPGAEGYWKLYGATMASIAAGNYLGGAVYPSLFHQDPRYFWKGTGSVKSRVFYAISRTVICRGDNGKNQFSYSGVLGDMSAGALSNLWYPRVDRHGVGLTLTNGLLGIASDAIGNLEQEFVFKWFTPGSRKRKPNSESD